MTGGFNGRVTPEFAIFGFHFASDNPELMVLDVPAMGRPSDSGTSVWPWPEPRSGSP